MRMEFHTAQTSLNRIWNQCWGVLFVTTVSVSVY